MMYYFGFSECNVLKLKSFILVSIDDVLFNGGSYDCFQKKNGGSYNNAAVRYITKVFSLLLSAFSEHAIEA